MAKELYIYSGIYSFTSEDIIRQYEENKQSDIVIRMNTNGGDPQAAWGMIAKMKEHKRENKKTTTIKVDGKAISSGFYMLPYADKVEALNVSTFLVHRAAYSAGYESNFMTPEERDELLKINKDLRSALESKVDPIKFALLTGVTFDQLFDPTTRIDVRLNAQQAYNIGLVNVINDINDSAIAANGKYLFDDISVTADVEKILPKENKPNTNMTLEELKLKHPDVYASVIAKGVEIERDRVGAWLTFVKIDAEAVSKGIKEGDPISQTAMAELSLKSFSQKTLKDIEAESTTEVQTEEVEDTKKKTANAKKVEDFEAEVKSKLGLK